MFSETSDTVRLTRLKTVPLLETWLESILDMPGVSFKAKFNALHTGCIQLCQWPRIKTLRSKTCATALTF